MKTARNHCAFLTMDNLDEFECYDRLLIPHLSQLGWTVTEVPWRENNVKWDYFDAVIIRSPWDYQDDPLSFLQVLLQIQESSARLLNDLELVAWNLDKNYLRQLEQTAGIPIVPTFWQERFDAVRLVLEARQLNTDEIIIKPTISANADNTWRLFIDELPQKLPVLSDVFHNRGLMLQPFMNSIVTEGEYSLFYFGGIFSHAILKTPFQGDFRVQEEHGGRLKSVAPEVRLIECAEEVIQALPQLPLYARVDMVRDHADFKVMEVELIEPSLYFNMDEQSPERFARVFNQWMQTEN